jgi:hypothetical protein
MDEPLHTLSWVARFECFGNWNFGTSNHANLRENRLQGRSTGFRLFAGAGSPISLVGDRPMIRHKSYLFAILLVCIGATATQAEEPNDSFGERTVLGAGVLSVDDTLTPGFVSYPDTYLGTLGFFGNIEFEDDDSSEYGDGYASGLSGIPINPGGTIDFLVTGCCDTNFTGNHSYSGEFEVIVDVFDFFGDYVETLNEFRMLQPGVVEEFDFLGDENWIDGSYNINIDNTVGSPSASDIDYFTFTGLTSGSNFSAEVTDATSGFDSILGWFDGTGNLIESDDNDGFENLSLINGVVPANGQLTFAVTGFNDVGFVGDHSEDASYSLEVNLFSVTHPGDFDNDDDVDGRDFLRWQRKQSPNNGNLADLQAWQTNYGYNGSLTAVQAVPEPATVMLLIVVSCAASLSRKRLKPS